MPIITVLGADNVRTEIELESGSNIMQALLARGIAGFGADCGGACQCATCHVVVDEQSASGLPAMDDMEDAMLDCATQPRRPTSRLSCQLTASDEMDGMVVQIPA